MSNVHSNDFTVITELPGSRVTAEQQARLCQRYGLARQHAAGRRVLEAGCGSGLGLGYVAETAAWLVAGDYTEAVLAPARNHYGSAALLTCFDAQHIPFGDGTFDLILCFGTIYFFARPELFLADCRRVLDHNGLLLIGSENNAWPHFVPSPLSVHYYAASELHAMLVEAGFGAVEMWGSFGAESYTPQQQLRASLRRAVAATGIFQRWPQARELLKPLVYRDTVRLSYDLCQGANDLPPLVPLDPATPNTEFKVFYALARVKESTSKT